MHYFLGAIAFKSIRNHRVYLNSQYPMIEHISLTSHTIKLLAFIDYWLKGLLFRLVMIQDILMSVVLAKEIDKRQQSFIRIIQVYSENLLNKKMNASSLLIQKLRVTHRQLMAATHQWTHVYRWAIAMWFAFMVLYNVAEINRYVMSSSSVKGKLKNILLFF